MDEAKLIIPHSLKPSSKVKKLIQEFLRNFPTYEFENDCDLVLYFDRKSSAYYLLCHIKSEKLVKYTDLEATLELNNEEDVIYKLNREITEDQGAYILMEDDAKEGRSFEDMVIEYDKSYHPLKPLKVYGGQHRIRAITNAQKESNTIFHGIRVYFDLDRNQKVEIANFIFFINHSAQCMFSHFFLKVAAGSFPIKFHSPEVTDRKTFSAANTIFFINYSSSGTINNHCSILHYLELFFTNHSTG